MGHTAQMDRLLINQDSSSQAGIGDNDGHITRSALTQSGQANPIMGHAVVTDTNPHRSR